MLARLERMSNQLPPRLKVILNLAISFALILFGVPVLWAGIVESVWGDMMLGAGLLLLAIFNLFT